MLTLIAYFENGKLTAVETVPECGDEECEACDCNNCVRDWRTRKLYGEPQNVETH
jgi:hypothetical protein